MEVTNSATSSHENKRYHPEKTKIFFYFCATTHCKSYLLSNIFEGGNKQNPKNQVPSRGATGRVRKNNNKNKHKN